MEIPDQTNLSRLVDIKIPDLSCRSALDVFADKKNPCDSESWLKELTFRHSGRVNDNGMLIYEEI